MRTPRPLLITATIGAIVTLATMTGPVGADVPSGGDTTTFVVDNPADIGDADPGDGQCRVDTTAEKGSTDKPAGNASKPDPDKQEPGKQVAKDLGFGQQPPPMIDDLAPTAPLPSFLPTIPPIDNPDTGGRCTLRAAVEESNAAPDRHHVVVLPSALGVYHLTEGELAVEGPLTVTRSFDPGSKRAAVNAGHRSRIFDVRPGAVLTIDGLFLAQGDAGELAGGAIFVRDATVHIQRSVVVHGRARQGGAIAVGDNGRLEARSTSFDSNRAGIGGAVYATGSVLLDQVSIVDNAAEQGGGIYLANRNASAFWAVNTSILNNTAGASGGGVHADGEAYIGLVHATIVGNKAAAGGGLHIVHRAEPIVLAHSILADNIDSDDPTAPDASPDCDGRLSTDRRTIIGQVSGRCWGYDVVDDLIGTVRNPIDPGLEPVRVSADGDAAGTGGELTYRRPNFRSPALDVVPAGTCFTDADMIRPTIRSGRPCDLGAVER